MLGGHRCLHRRRGLWQLGRWGTCPEEEDVTLALKEELGFPKWREGATAGGAFPAP